MSQSVEPLSVTWTRRAKTIPSMLATTAAAIIAAPLALPILALAEALHVGRRLPSVRLYLFALQYLINDSVEILLAPLYWVLAGFGRQLDAPSSLRRHARLQEWSINLLARRAEQLLDLGVELDSGAESLDRAGPTIVLTRHCNLFDASLPALLYQQLGFTVRGVIMAELLVDPGFDLIFGRLGSVFVPRDDGPEARRQISHLGANLDPKIVAAIFPEGRLFTPSHLDKAKERLAESNPERAARLTELSHVLPPKAGGLATLLAAAPTADVVLIRHTGLEGFQPFAGGRAGQKTKTTVRVSPIRFDRDSIPTDEEGVQRWLDDQWLALDRWVDAEQ